MQAATASFFDDQAVGAARAANLRVALFAIETNQPFSVVESQAFRALQIAHWKDQGAEGVRTVIGEFFIKWSAVIKAELAESKAAACGLPYIFLGGDVWKSDSQGIRYFGVVFYYLTKDFKMRVLFVTIAALKLTLDDLTEERSHVLRRFLVSILIFFGVVNVEDVSGSAGDGGPAERKLLEKLLPGDWNWCINHIAHLCITDAMGTSLALSDSKHLDARAVVQKVQRSLEYMNKSDKAPLRFNAAVSESTGGRVTGKKTPQGKQHRWTSLYLLFQHVLTYWSEVRHHSPFLVRSFMV